MPAKRTARRSWRPSRDRGGARPRRHRAGEGRADSGQAAVEFVALLPVLALCALAFGQATVAGWTAWSAAGAARVSARAEALGNDPAVAARAVLPAMLARRAKVTVGQAGARDAHRTTVRLRVPALLPGLRMGTVAAGAEVPSQEGA